MGTTLQDAEWQWMICVGHAQKFDRPGAIVSVTGE